ncbi:hypothetical protein OPKNFCMD_4419 [Methylobacterium crusticola]|uniref:Uncharacterized protein n=1 Tax=Methylobacterium crusticola TaxID=1697972 RepID=A0ABQ4R4D8_9HYPH|nr:hypothetical protein [Methylobacterium crusticola]GJD51664.1 hypothetical protein OPKNFCMD_4419 [Methylobacterium crusticola]
MPRFDARPALLCLVLALAPLPARAACTAPVPPPVSERPVKPALPQKPPCLDAKGGCPGWEAYTYNDAIKAYNALLAPYKTGAEAYARRLKTYAEAGVAYANCEMQSLQ